MPANIDKNYDPRWWMCDECRRVLGVVMRIIVSNGGKDKHYMRRLWIFSIDRSEENMPTKNILWNPPRGMFKVHAADSVPEPGGVQCSHCGALNEWTQSKESYERLISHWKDGKGI